jgi:uncharacterized DUF497 family protein
VSSPELQVEWDPAKAAANLMKHGVAFEVAATVLLDPLAATIVDAGHVEAEERWITMGRGATGELLTVVHTWQDVGSGAVRVRIISARKATRAELSSYEAGS